MRFLVADRLYDVHCHLAKRGYKISGDLLRDPIHINIGNIDELAANNPSHR
jgi:hypothetical protein